uniref:Predicted neuraminidase (Sialidase) n=1 Tax=Candidatus Kentrum sp. FM TaxID=2126340 RepID=A0A450S945_9GAMM|nr:MAG: Predicted neuraminidase (sialidase) [Candidatus Kentron sp. FM]VFJ50090.1 MAG: Predicted neuraminidase (sialidase) [Candidatus Kentron sp. FM]VFK08102.1 MAG: Predicted neuraminidase (sialidase) [Candidatus Kentron sp. FM]
MGHVKLGRLTTHVIAGSGEFIFPLQEKHVHGSSIVECPNGDLLVCWFYGSGEREANDVRIRGARLKPNSAVWSPVFEMADTPNLPDCNPVLFIDPEEKLWLFWIVVQAQRWENSILKVRTSTNYQQDGPPDWDWQDIILLQPGEEFAQVLADGLDALNPANPLWSGYAPKYIDLIAEAAHDAGKRQTGWMTRIHPRVLSCGRFLLPLYSDGFNISLVALSDDRGTTWRASEPIVGLGNVQPSLVQRKNGDIVAFMRDNGGSPNRVQTSVSRDRGETWTLAQDTTIPNPGSSVEVIALKSGTWLLVGNDTEEGRHRLAVYLSFDEGAAWQLEEYLEKATPEEGGEYSYPSVLQTDDGSIHVTYSYRAEDKETIKHVTFRE